MSKSGLSQRQMKTQHPSLQEQLLNEQVEQLPQESISNYKLFKERFFQDVQTRNRTIYLNGNVQPINYQNNLVKNTKYNVVTFIPKVLYNQFKFFFNMFFLVNALTQLIQVLRVGLFITYIGPLIMVLSLTMCKQAYDDFNTYKRDIEANSKQYDVIKQGAYVRVKSKDLRVGDLVKVQGGSRVPADILVLYSDNQQGTLFLKTDQLDGQTDWKLRKAVKMTQSTIKEQNDMLALYHPHYYCQAKAPQGEIYNFTGLFSNNILNQKLTLENTMWTTTVLTNGTVIGLVLYVGRQTRISMGGSSARTKFGILDYQINTLSKILFAIMVCLTVTFIILQQTEWSYVPIQFMRMLILLSAIIPISMRVNLDFAKLYYAVCINKDKYIDGAVTRNSNCPQELGRVKYILSDKTGTLTQNEMLFRQISINEDIKYTNQQVQEIIQLMKDYEEIPEGINTKERDLKNILTALALCHNVTPVYNEDKTKKDYQASSPDQITFVKMAEEFGLAIEDRTQSTMLLRLPSHKEIEYEIKYSFPFKSETKRMGIILHNKISNEYIFYLKGADAIMKQFVSNRQKRSFLQEECKDLSCIGLRTLVITRKILSEQFYERWSNRYEEAYNRFEPDQIAIKELMNELQSGVDFLGVTGIEDKLQKSLKSTIESLRSGGIKIWMITGDKMQTAQCIGRSCGLQKTTQNNIKIQQANSFELWQQQWPLVRQNLNQILIIDGKTLSFVLQDQNISHQFFAIAMKLPTVICCRCSPSQKKLLTEGVKNCKGKKEAVLGVGDGGNDVGMIQAADMGIGIVGKQGMQAALAADFSILQFRDLKGLLFWHGRLSYNRSSLLANFIIHRGFIISAIQLIFSCIFYYVSIPVFNSYLQLGYATLFTFWPVFALILDQDVSIQIALEYPKLYSSLQSVDYLSVFSFFVWIWKATLQATIIMVLTLVIFSKQTYLQFQTIAFTVLIITEYSMTLSEVHKLHLYLLIFVGASLICYIICLIFLNDYIHLSSLTFNQVLFILVIYAASWGPLFAWKLIRKCFWPTQVQKIMKNAKQTLLDRKLFNPSSVHVPRDSLLNYA